VGITCFLSVGAETNAHQFESYKEYITTSLLCQAQKPYHFCRKRLLWFAADFGGIPGGRNPVKMGNFGQLTTKVIGKNRGEPERLQPWSSQCLNVILAPISKECLILPQKLVQDSARPLGSKKKIGELAKKISLNAFFLRHSRNSQRARMNRPFTPRVVLPQFLP